MTLKSLCFLFLLLVGGFLFIGFQSPNQPFKNVRTTVLSENDPNFDEWREKVKLLKEKEEYSVALDFLEKAQKHYLDAQQWEQAINCVIEQAKIADNFEEIKIKLKYSELAIDLAQQYLPEKHPLFASVLRQKAEVFMWVEKIDSANHLLLQTIPVFEEHCMWTDFAWSEILLGVNYLNLYELEACQDHLYNVKSLISRGVLEETDAMEIQSSLLSILGVLYQIQGDYDRAIQNTKEALQLEQTAEVIDSTSIAAYLNNLGVFYLIKGDYQRSIDYLLQALHSHQDAAHDPTLLFNIGGLLTKQKKYRESIDYNQQSLQAAKDAPNELKVKIDGFNGLGRNFKYMGLHDSVVYYCQKAIAVSTDYRKADSWSLLGEISLQEGQPKQGILYFQKAIKAYQKDSIAESHSPFYLSHIYRNLGDAYFLNQNPNESLKFYQKAIVVTHATFKDSLSIQKNPPLKGTHDPKFFLEALHGKAKTLANFAEEPLQMKAALEAYQLLIQWTDSLQVGHATETARLDWAELFKQIYGEAIEVAYRHYQSTQDVTYLDLAFAFSEKSKNSLLLESLKAAEGKTYAGVPNSLLQKEKDLKLDIAFYERVLQEARTNQEEAKIKLYEQYFSKTRLELAALKEQLEQDFPKFYALKYGGKIISIEEVQSKILDKETAFLEYFIGDSTAFVFVITQNTADLVPLNSPSQIEVQVIDFRQTLVDTEAFYTDSKAAVEDYQQKAIQVYRAVLQPVLVVLPAGIQKLVLVPDEFLNSLPFEALTTAIVSNAGFDFGKLSYVLQEYEVRYAYSADLLLNNQDRQAELPTNDECLAFAPSYEEAEFLVQRGNMGKFRSTTENLQGTALEIQAIARFFDGQFDFGEKATKSQFKKYAPQFGILHLAMHGVPDFTNANFNHLKFTDIAAQNDSSSEDNLLHHYEIAGMDLQAQLAVLSACETGIGKYEKGEGVYSLARSFMYAGVPSVVMSLWKVSDKSTSQLMPFFYENLANGLSKGEALGQAKNRFLKKASLEFRHPFYWSAFVLLGNSDEIKQGYGVWIWWGIGGLVLVLVRRNLFRFV